MNSVNVWRSSELLCSNATTVSYSRFFAFAIRAKLEDPIAPVVEGRESIPDGARCIAGPIWLLSKHVTPGPNSRPCLLSALQILYYIISLSYSDFVFS